METFSLASVVAAPSADVRLRELADRLLRSCTRKPVDIQRWVEWRRGRRVLSFDMLDNALAAGGKRVYARAIYLQKAADLIDVDTDVPPLPDIQHRAVEADCASDRAREMAAIDGMTDEERKTLEVALTEESGVIDLFLERLRRSARTGEMRIG